CTIPLGALARIVKGRIALRAALFSPGGGAAVCVEARGAKREARKIGKHAAAVIRKNSPRGLLKTLGLA
ncbi:MAG TPA: hypothetical protein VD713_07975, partial [Sphingomonadales bacterium]|nr:hypothetical protein [Sphingomonadales bacterium]